MKTAEEKLTWVLRFIEMDLSQQSEKERLQLENDIKVFIKEVHGKPERKIRGVHPENLLRTQEDAQDLLQRAGFLALLKRIGKRERIRGPRGGVLEHIRPDALIWE